MGDNSNFNYENIVSNINEISHIIKIISNEMENFSTSIDNIISTCDTLKSYDGKRFIACPQNKLEVIDNVLYNVHYADMATIVGCADITYYSNLCKKKTEEFLSILTSISSIIPECQNSVADAYISTQNIKNVMADEDAMRFSGMTNYMATDEFKADNGEWVGITDENLKWWIDKPFTFKKDPNGLGTDSYLVYQEDDNGNLVGMGFTSASTVANYLYLVQQSQLKKASDKFASTDIGGKIIGGVSIAMAAEKLKNISGDSKYSDLNKIITSFNNMSKDNNLAYSSDGKYALKKFNDDVTVVYKVNEDDSLTAVEIESKSNGYLLQKGETNYYYKNINTDTRLSFSENKENGVAVTGELNNKGINYDKYGFSEESSYTGTTSLEKTDVESVSSNLTNTQPKYDESQDSYYSYYDNGKIRSIYDKNTGVSKQFTLDGNATYFNKDGKKIGSFNNETNIETIYNDNDTIDTYLLTDDNDKLLRSHTDPTTDTRIQYQENGEFSIYVKDELVVKGNQANGDTISVNDSKILVHDSNNNVIYDNSANISDVSSNLTSKWVPTNNGTEIRTNVDGTITEKINDTFVTRDNDGKIVSAQLSTGNYIDYENDFHSSTSKSTKLTYLLGGLSDTDKQILDELDAQYFNEHEIANLGPLGSVFEPDSLAEDNIKKAKDIFKY